MASLLLALILYLIIFIVFILLSYLAVFTLLFSLSDISGLHCKLFGSCVAWVLLLLSFFCWLNYSAVCLVLSFNQVLLFWLLSLSCCMFNLSVKALCEPMFSKGLFQIKCVIIMKGPLVFLSSVDTVRDVKAAQIQACHRK